MITYCIRCGKRLSITAETARRYPMGIDCGNCPEPCFTCNQSGHVSARCPLTRECTCDLGLNCEIHS